MRTSVGWASLLVVFVTVLSPAVTAREITVLYTNDIESVYEPVEAFWRDDITLMGGMPFLSTQIQQFRGAATQSVLLDAGDIFTGSLSKATQGKLVFDLYSEMGYDAVNLGNHEFEYGWQALTKVMPRARFPVLNANVFFEGTELPIGQQYAILQQGDVRVGVIGVMGVDAFLNTMMKANRKGLYVRPPAEVLQPIINELRAEVDLMIVLTHQNRTAPMQTNKEADPEVQRGFDEDYALAGQLRGVDMIIGGHSDNGLARLVKHPDTGTLIGMTFGQGMHLGYARFEIDDAGKVSLLEDRLVPIDAGKLAPDLGVTNLIERARSGHPQLTRKITYLASGAPRRYYRESILGNLLADLLRQWADTDVAMIPAGAIRADLQAGDVSFEAVLNVFPFTDTVAVTEMSGAVLKQVFEKSLSLEYGLSQFSNIELIYDGAADPGQRLQRVSIGGEPLVNDRVYSFATGSFNATGGENYRMFDDLEIRFSETLVSEALIEEMAKSERMTAPLLGRQRDISLPAGGPGALVE